MKIGIRKMTINLLKKKILLCLKFPSKKKPFLKLNKIFVLNELFLFKIYFGLEISYFRN